EAARSVFDAWVALLADGNDVAVSQIARDAEQLDQLVKTDGRLTRLCEPLRAHLTVTENPANQDWSAPARAAQWMLDQLVKHGGTVPAHVARVVSDPATRRAVAAALVSFERTYPGVRTGYLRLKNVFPDDQDISTGLTLGAAPMTALRKWLLE